MHDLVKQACGFIAGFFVINGNTGKGWDAGFTDQDVIIDAKYCDFIWNLNIRDETGIENLACAVVVRCKNRRRFWKLFQPGTEALSLAAPYRVFSGGDGEYMACFSGRSEVLLICFLSPP